MATYVLMTKLSPEITKQLRSRREIGREWRERVRSKCPEIKWLAHYALLGPYDFMDIYEAPNEEVAARVSMLTEALGAQHAESWTAIPYARFLDLIEDL